MWRTWGGNASALTRNPHPTLRATFSFVIKEKGWGRGIRGGSLNSLAGFASQYFGYFLPSFRYVRVLGTLGGEVYESRRQRWAVPGHGACVGVSALDAGI